MDDISKKKANEKEFKDKLELELKTQFNRGVQVGSAAIAKLVLEKLGDRSHSLPQRITDIQKLCAVPINALNKESEAKK